MTNGIEGASAQEKQIGELIKQIRAVNAVLGMNVLPSDVTEEDAYLDVRELKEKYPVRFQVYTEVNRYIRESVGGTMEPSTLGAHSKRISEWRNRIFEGGRPAGHFSLGEFLDRPEYKDRSWNNQRTRNRVEIFTLVRNKLSEVGVVGREATIQGYKTMLYKEEDLRKAAEQLPS